MSGVALAGVRIPARDASVPSARTDHILIADALRAAAILSVVAYHLVWTARPSLGHRTLTLGFFGVWGVDCFFVLTGFLLGRPFLRGILDPAQSLPSTRQFYVRRLLRIYPMYLTAIVTVALAAFALTGRAPTSGDLLAHAFLVHGLFAQYVYSIDSPLWTMGIDAAFYLAIPLVALGARASLAGRSRGARVRSLACGLIAVAIACCVYRFVQYERHPEALADYASSIVYVRNLLGMSFAFAVGLLVALALETSLDLGRRAHVMLVAGGLVLWAVELALRLEVNPHASAAAFARAASIDPLAAVSSGMLLYGLVLGRFEAVRSFAASPVVQRTAVLSYGIYLFHMPVITAIKAALLPGSYGFAVLALLAVAGLPVIAGIAYVANRYVETPFLALKLRFAERS